MNVAILVGSLISIVAISQIIWQLRRHPRGLFVLFFAELWERFSFYGMRSLLIFYLTEHFLFSDTTSQARYATYNTLVYVAPLIGGFIADRFLGARRAVMFGALLLVAGHFTMAIEGPPATQTLTYAGVKYSFEATGRMADRHVCLRVNKGCYEVRPLTGGGLQIDGLAATDPLPSALPKRSFKLSVQDRQPLFVNILYLALSLIVMGGGFLKSNISTIVGQLYTATDERRQSGFTLYFCGFHLGAFWATLVCGLVGQTVGWWAGFGLAGIGMLSGLLVFARGRALLEGRGEPPRPATLKRRLLGAISLETLIYIAGLLGIVLVWLLVRYYAIVGWMQIGGWAFALGYVGWYMIAKCNVVERDRLLLAMLLVACSIVFFTLTGQAGSSLNQFAERNTRLPNQGFWTVTPAQTQSFSAGCVLLFGPVFAAIWAWLGRRGRDFNATVKFGLGLVQVGFGFLVLVWAAHFRDATFRVPMAFLALSYLLQSTGEIFLNPVGLAEMTKLAPINFASTMLAIWFLATSAAQYVAGMVARLTATDTIAGHVVDPAKALVAYTHVFGKIGAVAIGVGVALLCLSWWVNRLAHGVSAFQTANAAKKVSTV